MTERALQEYQALRATIAARGTARVWVVVAGTIAWAALITAVFALALPPVTALVPLLVLAASFEGAFAIHVGVERIGRYLLVAHDDDWERVAGAFGRPIGAIGVDPLFTTIYLVAAVLTALPLLSAVPVAQEVVAVVAAQAAFAARVLSARAAAARQREVDTARFREIRKQADDAHRR